LLDSLLQEIKYLFNIIQPNMGDTEVVKFVEACQCRGGDVPTVRRLIAEGVNINGMHLNITGLMGAIMRKNSDIVNILLACPDIDVNIRNEVGGLGALDFAIHWANTEAVSMLLSRGEIRLDNTDIWGNTVLHVACYEIQEEYVQMILAHPSCTKATLYKKNDLDETAETLAEKMGYHDCVRIIREYLTNDEGQEEEDVTSSVEMTSGRNNSEALSLSSSELDAVIEDFEAVEVAIKDVATTRANQIRAEITGLEHQIMKQKQLLGEIELKRAADLAKIIKKKEDMKSLKRRRAVDPSPQTGSRAAHVPECPVCYERMLPPRRIYTCGNGHVICSNCRARMEETGNYMCISHCGARYTGRATTVEQMIEEFMGNK